MTDLGVGQESGVILGGGSLVGRVGVGGGGAARVASSRLVSLCASALDGTAQVLALAGTGIITREGIGVRYSASDPPLGNDAKGGPATPTQVGWWPDRKFGWPSGA